MTRGLELMPESRKVTVDRTAFSTGLLQKPLFGLSQMALEHQVLLLSSSGPGMANSCIAIPTRGVNFLLEVVSVIVGNA